MTSGPGGEAPRAWGLVRGLGPRAGRLTYGSARHEARLLLLTDGFTETRSPSGELLGIGRVTRLLTRSARQSLEDALEGVSDATCVHRGSAEPTDDVTFVAVEILCRSNRSRGAGAFLFVVRGLPFRAPCGSLLDC